MSSHESAHGITTHRGPPAVPMPTRAWLVVIGDGVLVTHALPESGEVTLGRSRDNDVQIDHPSISRRHAVMRMGSPITIEDLDSANGTTVRETGVTLGVPMPVAPGEVIGLGATMAVIQQRGAPVRSRCLWPHGFFEARVEEECARASHASGRFALLHVRCAQAGAGERVEQVLAEVLRPMDVTGLYGPDEYELLLLDSDANAAAGVERRIHERLAAARLPARIGVAIYPASGRTAASLLSRARKAPRDDSTESVSLPRIAPGSAMYELRRLARQVASSHIGILILGETGAGKEVLAETIHSSSPRANRPMLRLSCAAMPEALFEAELFGYERGAFTGATGTKPGLLETAHEGTVFLDEIGELPLPLQAKLLRVIEDRRVHRLGSLSPRSIDVRFIAATNRDLDSEVAAGTFRRDLFFRVNGVTLVVPPLRDRVGEIADLARAFVAEASRAAGRASLAIAPDALALLERYAWPGNVRELRNVMERAVLLAGDGPISAAHLPADRMRATHHHAVPPEPARIGGAVRDELAELERRRILEVLDSCAGNQSRAAKQLGMSRGALVRRLGAYGLPRPRG